MSGGKISGKPVNILKKTAVLVLIFIFILTGCKSTIESGGIEEKETTTMTITGQDTEKNNEKETTEPVTTPAVQKPEPDITTQKPEPSVPQTNPPVQQTEPVTEPPLQNQPQNNGTPFGSHGTLSVSGTRLTDQYGAGYTLRGISTHGLSWFPDYVNYEMFKQMRDEWNVNVVRLAMYTAEYNGYCTGDRNNQEKLKRLIDDGVNYASQLGLYVIID